MINCCRIKEVDEMIRHLTVETLIYLAVKVQTLDRSSSLEGDVGSRFGDMQLRRSQSWLFNLSLPTLISVT